MSKSMVVTILYQMMHITIISDLHQEKMNPTPSI
jgi:hypothetical protein